MRGETIGAGHEYGGRAVMRGEAGGDGALDRGRRPAVICLAATEQDRRDVNAILGSADGRSATTSTDLASLGTVTAAAGERRAVLAGPDAAAAILTGRGTSGETGGGSGGGSGIVDVWSLPTRMANGGTPHAGTFDGAPPIPAATGETGGLGPPPGISPRTGTRVPTGPLADRCSDHDRAVLAGLTPREAEVAELVGNGLNVGEIAASLGREKTTVISHRRSLLRKIGCRDALGIARFAYRTGLSEA